MRNILVFALLLLASCHTTTPNLDSTDSENKKEKSVRDELDQIKSSKFGTASKFLISPTLVAKNEYYEAYWWSYWKEKLNYREENIPQGIILYSGSPENDWGQGKSMKWKNCQLYEYERFSFSKTGQLLEHVQHDSCLFFYDSTDRLRQTIAYSRSNQTEIEYIRLYEYDLHGNILWSAVFYQNQDSIYLNHYDSYNYLKSDSGTYIKTNHFFVNRGNTGSLTKSVKYSYFDENYLLRREFQIFSGGSTGVTFLDYSEFDGKYDLCKKETQDILNTKVSNIQITERDSLNRVIYFKHSFGGITESHLLKDSIIYFPNEEMHQYHYDIPNSLYHSLEKKKFDAYNNPIQEERFQFLSLKNLQSTSISKTTYELLDSGTWYSSITKSTDFEGPDPYNWEEYQYRKFLSHPIRTLNGEYHENPLLKELIELNIPTHNE